MKALAYFQTNMSIKAFNNIKRKPLPKKGGAGFYDLKGISAIQNGIGTRAFKRIIINDDTNDRILIGYQKDGF